MAETTAFDESEIPAILEAFDRALEAPLPANTGLKGCFALVCGVVLGVLTPEALKSMGVEVTGSAEYAVLMPAALLALLGLMWFLRGSGARIAALQDRAEEALVFLSGGAGHATPEERREAAVYLIGNAWNHDGHRHEIILDVEDVKNRLGEAYPFVLAVERVLVQHEKTWPVFGKVPQGGLPCDT
ncbi:MAG: hypothetical protein ACYTHM_07360 [Planctomycetota bacterium]|jgi:hypothetical protein